MASYLVAGDKERYNLFMQLIKPATNAEFITATYNIEAVKSIEIAFFFVSNPPQYSLEMSQLSQLSDGLAVIEWDFVLTSQSVQDVILSNQNKRS